MNAMTHALAPPSVLATAPPVINDLGVGLARDSSTNAAAVDSLFMFIFWLCVAFFLVLMGLSAIFVVKYRRRPGVPQQRSVSHNTPLELTWSVGPLFILIVIFFWGFELYMDMHTAPGGAEPIDVLAQKWSWEWTYDNGGATPDFVSVADKIVPVFAAPAGRPIKLTMISHDVIHSLFVPDFRKKLDIFPNRYTSFWFEAMDAGEEHYLFCAEYCGEGHSQMGAIIRVLDPADYLEWKAKAGDPGGTPVERGQRLYIQKACNSCHTTDGAANTGPTWLDLYGTTETVTAGGATQQVIVDANYIRESILEPAAKIVQGFPNQMNSYQGQLSEDQISALIAYIKSLSAQGRAELDSEAAEQAEEAPADAGAAGQ